MPATAKFIVKLYKKYLLGISEKLFNVFNEFLVALE
jgi:hypothetical protein